MNKKLIIQFSLFGLLLLPLASCDKLLTVQSDIQISDVKDLLKTPEDARQVLNGAYDVLANVLDGDIQNINEVLSDNAAAPINFPRLLEVYERSTTTINSHVADRYRDLYLAIFRSNLILNYGKDISGISIEDLNSLEGESKFIRATAHFWLVKTFAQPFGYSSDNSHPGIVIRTEASQASRSRSSVAQCYASIQSDLISAYEKLPETNGYYATKYAAAAQLAYVYFLQNDFANCAAYADIVINSGNFSLDNSLDIFHALSDSAQNEKSTEMIFGFNSIPSIFDSRNEGFRDLYYPGPTGANLSLSLEAFNLFANNQADDRNDWVKQSDQSQYQLTRFVTVESNQAAIQFYDMPLLRLTMMKLIRAESLGELNTNLTQAIADLNEIRDRAFGVGINPVANSTSADEIVNLARIEFRKEMIGEGYYIDQLKRRGGNGENIVIRGASWNCPGMAVQFPNSEINAIGFELNPEGGCN